MGGWAVLIVSGICTFFCFYMAFLAFRIGDGGVFLFAGFGVFFGILCAISLIKVVPKKGAFLKKIDEKISGGPTPISFVPHWFMMAAIIICISIIAAILITIYFS